MTNKNNSLKLNRDELLSVIEAMGDGSILPLVITGWSMSPTFVDGETIVYLLTGIPETIKKGDVVFFQRENGQQVLHRVRKVKGNELTINGDEQTWIESIRKEQVLAKVIKYQRKGSSDKMISVTDTKYRLYSNLWSIVMPIRPLIFRIHSRIKKLRKK